MKMKQGIIRLLSCILMICLLSTTAFAAEVASYVAEVNGKQYTSIETALAEASEGDTVKLLADCSATSLTKTLTYDLNGNTLTYSGPSIQPGEKEVLSFVDSSVTGTQRGGTLKLMTDTGNTAVSILNPTTGGTVNASNISIIAEKCSVFYPKGDAAAVSVTNCDVTAACYGVGTNAASTDNYNVVITLKGSNITSTSDDGDNTAVLINVAGTLNVEDCVITGDRQGVIVRAGTATIENSEIVVTGKFGDAEKYQTSEWKSGNEVPSSSQTAGNYVSGTASTYQEDAKVTVTNTVVTSQDENVPAIYVDANQSFGSSVNISGETLVTGSVMKGQHQAADNESAKTNEISISGGTFSGDVSEYLAEGADNVEYNTVLKASNCTENGIGRRITVVDGKQTVSYYVIPAAHKPGEAVEEDEVAAKCEETGSYESVVYCSVCEEELSRETVTVEALGHTEPTEGVETVAATCAVDGSKIYVCTVCSQKVTDIIPATGEHSWEDNEYIDATCTENGKAGGQVCSVCGAENPENPPEDLGEVAPATGHKWVLDEDAEGYKPATCVDDGMGTYVCSVCEETKTEVIDATGIHTEKLVGAKEPTCGETGHTEGVQCSVCGEVLYGMEEIPATGEHTEEIIEGTPATCQVTGLTDGVKCSECGEILVAQKEIPVDPDAHDYEVTVLKDATCTTAGVGKYVCQYCGASKYAAIPAEHKWNEGEVTTAATCTKPGVMTYSCENCDATYTEEIPAEHRWNEGVTTIGATCGTDGEIIYTCTVCSETKTEAIPATGEHNFVDDSVKDATCTEPAMVGSICSVCGQANGELIPVGEPNGHKYEEEITREATCVDDGEITYTCSVCNDSYTETIPATGEHADGWMPAKEPTCVEDGYTEGVQCSVCGEVLYGMEAIPATGEHTEEVVPGKAATCQEAGLTDGVKCAVCGKILVAQEEIPVEPDAHNYEVTPLKEASCTTTGIGKYVCSICGDYYYATLETSHTWGKPTVIKAATCNEEGEQTYPCTMCGETKTESIPATGAHHYVEDVVPATCTENAKVGFVCDICGTVDPDRETVEVPDSMIDHDYEVETKEATCTEAGSVTKTCKVCGDVVIEEIPATGHTAGEPHYEKATCTENGKDVVRCSACGEILEENDMGELEPATGHTEEVIPAVPATCGTAGSTEGVKCSKCDEILVAPEEIPADPDAHEYELTKDLKPATCSATGIGKYVCQYCGDYYYGVIPTVPHTFDDASGEVTKEATCTEEGILTLTCDECGATVEQPIEALGHDWSGEKVSDDNAYIYKECSRCHETEIIAWIACQHEETEIRDAKEASCTEAGYTGDTYCVTCGELISEGEEIAKTEHSEVVIEGQAASCTESGLTDGVKCSVCGAILMEQEEIPAVGHQWDEGVITTEPTEETEGVKTYTCTVCSETRTESIPAHEHEHVYVAVKTEPTCTEKGYTTYTCACGDSYAADEVEAVGHTPAAAVYENEVAATCEAEGSYDEVAYCEVCNEELSRETKSIDKLEHTEEIIPGKEATCTETGLTEGVKCSVCGTIIKAQETILAQGHSLVDDAAVAPNCTEAGKEAGKHCENCDYTEGGETIPATGHTPAAAVRENEVAATCEAEGSYDEVVYCEVCGEQLSRETRSIDKLSHTEETIPGHAADCTNTGLTDGVKCSVCGAVIKAQETIPATGHTSTQVRDAKAATCIEEGYTGDTYCTVCGEKVSAGETIPANGHSYRITYTYNNDYSIEYVHYTCTVCGYTYVEEVVLN